VIPLSLYLHIPWCISKCPYCDFHSTVAASIDEAGYRQALLAEFSRVCSTLRNRTINTVFIGGGTPSLLSGAFYQELLNGLQGWVADDAEITIEANPESISAEKLTHYRDAGINRLSIGAQSFHAENLVLLQRAHTAQQTQKAVKLARQAGFDNINLDLMFGLPHPSERYDLDTAIQLNPEHISWYQLTLEPGTAFFHAPPSLPDDDVLFHIQQYGINELTKHHYHRYEISAYARDGRECLHNRNYWQFGDYIGLGVSAHSKLTDEHYSITRWNNPSSLTAYVQHASSPTPHILSREETIFEFMLNNLRLRQGVVIADFSRYTGLEWAIVQPIIEHATQQGLLQRTSDRILPTDHGYNFLNDLTTMFLAA
jgi:putative oxygen-independent coproporphyrinogen III oxidase